ncbi:hypothetical protein BDV59DRAFT_174015 [Aspergillus ambiguus]|uniref:uncharacterized protein n=1 Tax=Aspergillus ambiguus TaxID=176160 RepID=UPI003CCD68E8
MAGSAFVFVPLLRLSLFRFLLSLFYLLRLRYRAGGQMYPCFFCRVLCRMCRLGDFCSACCGRMYT